MKKPTQEIHTNHRGEVLGEMVDGVLKIYFENAYADLELDKSRAPIEQAETPQSQAVAAAARVAPRPVVFSKGPSHNPVLVQNRYGGSTVVLQEQDRSAVHCQIS